MKRILIVDDFEAGRLVLRERLELEGYACQEVENGLEALETLQAKKFDLVITDNKMPKMTGLELIQSLAQLPKDQRPAIILLTGHPTHEVYQEARRAKVYATFKKPYDFQELFLKITSALDYREKL